MGMADTLTIFMARSSLDGGFYHSARHRPRLIGGCHTAALGGTQLVRFTAEGPASSQIPDGRSIILPECAVEVCLKFGQNTAQAIPATLIRSLFLGGGR